MKNSILLILLLASVLCGGCSKEEASTSVSPSDLITFKANVATRATAVDNTSIANMGVFCYYTDDKRYEIVKATAKPNKLINTQVYREGENWKYTTPIEWGAGIGHLFTFFGYAPYAGGKLVEGGNGVENQTNPASPGAPAIFVTQNTDLAKQIDFLIATPNYDLMPAKFVTMNFTHAFTRIGFKAFSVLADVNITKITINNAHSCGMWNLNDPGAFTPDANLADFPLTFAAPISLLGTTTQETAKDLSAPSNYFFMPPCAYPTLGHDDYPTEIIFEYTIGGVAVTKTYPIVETWLSNKTTTYTFEVKADKLNVAVTIAPWDDKPVDNNLGA